MYSNNMRIFMKIENVTLDMLHHVHYHYLAPTNKGRTTNVNISNQFSKRNNNKNKKYINIETLYIILSYIETLY